MVRRAVHHCVCNLFTNMFANRAVAIFKNLHVFPENSYWVLGGSGSYFTGLFGRKGGMPAFFRR